MTRHGVYTLWVTDEPGTRNDGLAVLKAPGSYSWSAAYEAVSALYGADRVWYTYDPTEEF